MSDGDECFQIIGNVLTVCATCILISGTIALLRLIWEAILAH